MSSLGGLGARLELLDTSLRGDAMLKAITAGARALQKETKTELARSLGAGATRKGLLNRKPPREHPSMSEGVRVIRDSAYRVAVVSIMGDFRLKWFEKGTNARYAGGRKDRSGVYPGRGSESNYRGAIRPLRFFLAARSREDNVTGAITRELDKIVNKVLK